MGVEFLFYTSMAFLSIFTMVVLTCAFFYNVFDMNFIDHSMKYFFSFYRDQAILFWIFFLNIGLLSIFLWRLSLQRLKKEDSFFYEDLPKKPILWWTDELGNVIQGKIGVSPVHWKEWLRTWHPHEMRDLCFLMPDFFTHGQFFHGCCVRTEMKTWCWIFWSSLKESPHAFQNISTSSSKSKKTSLSHKEEQINFWITWSHEFSLPILILGCDGEKHIPLMMNQAAQEWLHYEDFSFFSHHFSSISPDLSQLHKHHTLIQIQTILGIQEKAIVLHKMPLKSKEKKMIMIFLLPLRTPFLFHHFRDKILGELPMALAWSDRNGHVRQKNGVWNQLFGTWLGHSETSLQKIFSLNPGKSVFSTNMPSKPFAGFPFPSKIVVSVGGKKVRVLFLEGQFLEEEGVWIHALEHSPAAEGEEDAQDKIQVQKLQTLGKLASSVAHDFNNILTAILGFCDLILQQGSDDKEAVFMDVTQIKQSAIRASNLARQLILFARDDVPEKKSISLHDILTDMTTLLKRLVGAKIDIKLKLNDMPCYIFGDTSQFEQILLNLTVNARDAILPTNGHVIITIKKVIKSTSFYCIEKNLPFGDYICLEVKDTGTGIATEHLPNVFKRFFSTKDPGKGTGLGLATCWDLMDQWEGGIQIESQLGKGTCIKLWFPEYKGPHEGIIPISNHTARIASLLPNQQKILLVEDEDPVRLFAGRSLRGHGYFVDEARDGKKALEFLQQNLYHLLITDVIMPGSLDGLKLAEQGRKICPELKLLFVSGYEQNHILQGISDRSQVSFLQKPFNMHDLIEKVSEVLDFKSGSEHRLKISVDSK